MDQRPKCKARHLRDIKLLEANMGRTLFDINHSKIFFDPPPAVIKIQTKINKRDLIKLKSLCPVKETINKMKRQPSESEKIFANEATDKGLISKTYKQLMQLRIKKTSNPIKKKKKWAEDLNRNFSKEDIQMPHKHMRRCSTSLSIKEVQIKTTIKCQFTPIRMAINKIKNTGEGMEKTEPFCTAGENVN